MMRAVFALALIAIGAACSSNEPMNYYELEQHARREERAAIERPDPDTCQREAHMSLIGQDGASIDRSTLPAATRVICHNCPVTLDYSSARLNVELGPDGKVVRLRCG